MDKEAAKGLVWGRGGERPRGEEGFWRESVEKVLLFLVWSFVDVICYLLKLRETFNQDPVEIYFGQLCSCCGWCEELFGVSAVTEGPRFFSHATYLGKLKQLFQGQKPHPKKQTNK